MFDYFLSFKNDNSKNLDISGIRTKPLKSIFYSDFCVSLLALDLTPLFPKNLKTNNNYESKAET